MSSAPGDEASHLFQRGLEKMAKKFQLVGNQFSDAREKFAKALPLFKLAKKCELTSLHLSLTLEQGRRPATLRAKLQNVR